MLMFPHAKINLGLNVVSRRPDGFHNIESVFYPVNLSDILEFIVAPDEKMMFVNSGIETGNSADNLCIKAYNLLKDRFQLPPLHIHLNKIIPVGAGLGGGSSDGAFMLKSLNEFFDLGLSQSEMSEMVAMLGSDCPFFIHQKPLFAFGKGDQFQITDIDLKGLYIAIVYPDLFVSTKEAYNGISPEKPEISILDIIRKPIEEWKTLLKNDFEKSVFKKYPGIELVKMELYNQGADYAAMSGSGSSVFGIFKDKPDLNCFDERYYIWDGLL